MLFERTQEQQYIVGFDLGDDSCQISYLNYLAQPMKNEPKTFSTAAGEEKFDIPTVLYKSFGVNRWFCGEEAARMSSNKNGTFLPGLLSLAVDRSPVTIENSAYDPVQLLSLFISRTLTVLNNTVPFKEIAAIMFTARDMSEDMIGVLESVRKRLSLECRIYYESYGASFYNYLLVQQKILRDPAVFLAEMEKNGTLRFHKLQYNIHTRPIVAFETVKTFPALKEAGPEGKDAELAALLAQEIGNTPYASAFLVGHGFYGNWMRKSLAVLCRGRRAFLGNNLFSKGAVYGALFKIAPPAICGEYFFLDGNKLPYNIGIRAAQHGGISYHAILDAGINWYEVNRDVDLILEETNEIHLVLTPLRGGETRDFLIRLDGLPARSGRTARIRMHFRQPEPDSMQIRIEDLGFGAIFPSTGLKWEQELHL